LGLQKYNIFPNKKEYQIEFIKRNQNKDYFYYLLLNIATTA